MSLGLRILVDLDDTVGEFNYELDGRFGAYPQLDHLPRYEERVDWDFGANDVDMILIRQIMSEAGLFGALRVTPGAKAAIKTLEGQGHDVWFVSTPYNSNPTCASDKLRWVEEHFGQHLANRTILTHDKTMVEGDVLIDDRPVITGINAPRWQHILFDRPWNRHVNGARLKSWDMAEVSFAIWESIVRR